MKNHKNHHLFLENTLTREKELFVPQTPTQEVSLYVCGITPYDYSHIGHGRTYINFDLLYRLLQHLSYKVTYVRNITDIDDKLLNKAEQQDGTVNTYTTIADFFYADFIEQLKKLNCLPPSIEPRATESIPKIIEIIEALLIQGHAYQSGLDIYFDISSHPDYGKLSKKKQEQLLSGARVEINELKRNPGDFALWKGNNAQQFWNSPWGYGRPGWHIECSAMIAQHLPLPIDIHAGGIDLIFPHHENEIAQSESAHKKTLARFWLHNEFININKEKMSKSLNNTIKLKDLTELVNPMAFRFYILQHHYKTPIDFSYEGVTAAQNGLNRLYTSIKKSYRPEISCSDCTKHPTSYEIIGALCDNLNTPKALSIIFENIKKIQDDSEFGNCVAHILEHILGIQFEALETIITPEISALIAEREQARLEKNWKKSDELRDALLQHGYQVHDKKI